MKLILALFVVFGILFQSIQVTGWMDTNYTNRTCQIISNPHASAETNVTFKLSLNMSTFGVQSENCTDVEWGNQTVAVGYWNSTPCNNSGETNVTWWVNVPFVSTTNDTQICMYYNYAADTTDGSDITTVGVFGDDFDDNDISDWSSNAIYAPMPIFNISSDGYIYGNATVSNYGGHINISDSGVTTTMTEFRVLMRSYVVSIVGQFEMGDCQTTSANDDIYLFEANAADNKFKIKTYPGGVSVVDDDFTQSRDVWRDIDFSRDRDGFWYILFNDVAVNLDSNTSNTSYSEFRSFSLRMRENDRIDHILFTKWCKDCDLDRQAEEMNITPSVSLYNLTNFSTEDTTPSIDFNYTDDDLTAKCYLFLNGTAYGVNASTENATQTTLTVNTTMAIADYEVNVSCWDGLNTGVSSSVIMRIFINNTISFIDEMTNKDINFSANKNGTLTAYCPESTVTTIITRTVHDYSVGCSIDNLKYLEFTLYDPKGNHYRTLIPSSIGNVSFYMINTTPTDVTINLVTFSVTDASLLYQAGIVHFKKTILTEGQKDIIDTIIGSDGKIYANLIAKETYTISVESADGTNSKTLGEYTVPDTTTTSQPLTIIDVTFIPTTYNFIGTDISWGFEMDTDAGRIYAYYNDSTGQTNSIKFWIYNITNVSARTEMYYDTVSSQSHHLFQWDYVTNGNENDTYLGYLEIDHVVHGNITESRPIAKGGIFYQWLGNIGAWYHIISVFLMVFVASIFGAKSAPIGAVILAIIAGFLFYIEWLPAIIGGAIRLTDLLMIALIALAILSMFIIRRRRI